MEAPCKKCPKKGCGSYHDICEEYQSYRKFIDKKQKEKLLKMDLDVVTANRFMRYRKATRSKQSR